MSVWTAIVTFNRKQLLAQSLEAVYAQTLPSARVIVVDNASTDGTPEMLAELGYTAREDFELLRLPANTGGAGGFAAAVRAGTAGDADWLWLMDDDCVPRPDALRRLIESPPARERGVVCLCPKVEYPNGGIDANQRGHFRRRLRPLPAGEYRPGHHPELGFMSFVGSLVSVDAARRTGPPKAEFFVWGDDVEYSFRLRRRGTIRLVPDSVVVHHRAAHAYETARSRALNRVSPVKFFPTPLERFWQNLCGLRNYIWMKREYESQSAVSAAGTTLQFVVKHVVWDDHGLRRLPWILRYARAGRRGDFRNVSPQRWVELVRDGRV